MTDLSPDAVTRERFDTAFGRPARKASRTFTILTVDGLANGRNNGASLRSTWAAMKPNTSSMTPSAIASMMCAVLTACGGGSGESQVTASAQISPVTESASAFASPASATVAASAASSVVTAAATAQAPTAKILSASRDTAPTPASAAPLSLTPQATQAMAGAATAKPATTAAATVAKAAIAAPAALPSTAKPTATPLVTPPVIATTTPAPPARNSPLWNLPAPAMKAGMLTGMALLTSPSTGLFAGARTAKEDWGALVTRFKTDASVANWVKSEQARVDSWMAQNFERPDLIGGWIYYYIDAKTGLQRQWAPSDPEPVNGTTDAERKFKCAWVAWGREYNIAQMHAAARIYRTTGLTKYADWAAKQLDFYAKQYTLWPISTYEGRSTMYMQGLDEAADLFALIDTARLLDGYVGSGRETNWRNQLFMPMATNLKATSAPKSNIQLWHASAIAAVAMRYKDAALLDYAISDPAGIRANMANGLTQDNLWIEGSFSYNAYVIDCLSRLLVAAGIEGYADRFTAEADSALRMLLAPMEYRFDDNSLPNPGDSTSPQMAINETAHWNLFRVMPTYWGVAKATAWRTWESLLDPPVPNKTASAPAIPTASTKNFNSLRWAVLRAGSWQAFVRYGGMQGNHWADEAFNFELRDGKTGIAVDPGTVPYGSPQHAGYFQRGPAGNEPLVDGDNQSKWAPGTLTNFDNSLNLLSAEQPAFQADAVVGRSFRLTESGLVEQSSIRIPSRKTRRLGMVFNSSCDFAPGSGVSVATGQPALPAVTAFGYWTNTTTYTTAANWQLTLKCAGNRNYLLQVWGPGAQRLYIGKALNTPMPSTRNALYYEVNGTDAVFESSITAQ